MTKDTYDLGRSRNARLNQCFAAATNLVAEITKVKGLPHRTPITDKRFWAEARDLVTDICQCFHEANAYNNCLLEKALPPPPLRTQEESAATLTGCDVGGGQ